MSEEITTLGGGCFWCLEAVFKELRGVTSVVSGYAGGHVVNNIGCNLGVRIHVPPGSKPPSQAALHAKLHAAQVAFQACLAQYRQVLTFQPPSRYWAFQWYETAIFLSAALVLSGFCFFWVRRRLS